ncbi:MAG: hypothetical protein HY819_05515 [Acidobacteria bacterium]|nr:hypothetical protein [Acidobacteriota bacterium]
MKNRVVFFLLVVPGLMVIEGHESNKVSLSKLYSDPAAYNHKTIRISGVISHGYEQFTLTDPNCPGRCGIWLEYGGAVSSGTIYCCGVSPAREREGEVIVEGISVPLVQDETFRKFDELIQKRSEVTVKATVIGQFFAGKQMTNYDGTITYWGSYGHFGMASLLVIQQVVSIDE